MFWPVYWLHSSRRGFDGYGNLLAHMKIWLRQYGSADFIGPLTLDETRVQIQTGSISRDFEALEATGQSYGALKRSSQWKRLGEAFPSAIPQPSPEPTRPQTSSQEVVGPRGSSQADIAELLRLVISNQQRQLDALRAIRWAIVGFSIWFIIQFWFLPKLFLSN